MDKLAVRRHLWLRLPTWRKYLFGIIFFSLQLLRRASPEEDTSTIAEYCQLESFKAKCDSDEVIIITSARYGRMRLGRCVKSDYGSLSCGADVLAEVDRKCSGRRECKFPVADLHGRQQCPEDLTPFLEASYTCMKVTVPTDQTCLPGQGIVLTGPSGIIASRLSENSDLGSEMCPWSIRVPPGQSINLTLINFARAPNPTDTNADDEEGAANGAGSFGEDFLAAGPRICYQFAQILESGARRTITECEGGPRELKAYTSSTHRMDIVILSRKSTDTYFLLKYEVMGCPNPPAPRGGHVRRVGDKLVVKCNYTEETWFLTCSGSKWRGELGNCSKISDGSGSLFPADGNFPYGILIVVAIGVALGVFFGGILLTLASFYMRRKRKDEVPPGAVPGNERVYNFNDADKRVGAPALQQPGGMGAGGGGLLQGGTLPHGTGGRDRAIMEAQVKDYLAEQQYQQYGYTDTGDSGYKGMSTTSSAHIYESPKFGRKHPNV